jgi:uncharacterized protein (DUF1501 family)
VTTRSPSLESRRAFLRRIGHLGVAGVGLPWAVNLAAMGEAAAFTASDYKALVCVFLYGGNDHDNTVVPYDGATHALYSSIRGGTDGIALARDALAATALTPSVALPDARQFALAPSLAPLKPLFDAGRLAVQLNVGPLIQPTTRAQYDARSVPLPPKLFSHNDQQSVWQSSAPEGSTVGWGGRIGDLAMLNNANSTFTCINVTGNAVFLAGRDALSYQVSSNGAVAINGTRNAVYGSTAVRDALAGLVARASQHRLEEEYAIVTRRSAASEGAITSALAGAAPNPLFTDAATNTLAAQLRLVARLIAVQSALAARRQVFLVSLGGFDHHDRLLALQPNLLGNVARALRAFHDVTVELGVANQVTTFTASDFGRTLASNGDGSDHGWGSHHFVLGGAVRGGRFYGTPPAVELSGPNAVGGGRLLPTTSVDQFAATLAAWFGVPANDLPLVVPNIGNYSARNLGFV